jgi:hypothetical protein
LLAFGQYEKEEALGAVVPSVQETVFQGVSTMVIEHWSVEEFILFLT